ncbi:MAG TPA: heme-binding domain-containing protein, partial [Verrucomicrobiae bacterium]
NKDGEADFYENFCDLIETSRNGHDYVTSLEKDRNGNFYFVDPVGAHRVSPDGSRMETLASGFRNPNGLGVDDSGSIITVAPQQGEWTPSSVICEIRSGGYYGYPGPKTTLERPLGFDPPLCYIPHSIDNSSGSQAWIPVGHWGVLGQQAIHLAWGRCTAMLLLRDTSSSIPQGATVPLPVHFLSGPDRAVFREADDSLYVVGSTGWQTSATKDGCFQRVRLTGKPVDVPVHWRAVEKGLQIASPMALDPKTAADPGSFSLKQWNYRYQAEYGSKDWSVAHPDKTGRDKLEVSAASLSRDGRTITLSAAIQPVNQMEISYNVDTASGETLRGQLWLTLNAVPKSSLAAP